MEAFILSLTINFNTGTEMLIFVVSLLHRNSEFRCFGWTETIRNKSAELIILLPNLPLELSVLKQPTLPLGVPVLQQPVLPLDVSVLQQPVLPLDVYVLQQPMLPLDVSVLQQPVLPLDVSVLQLHILPLDVSVLLQPVMSLDVSVLQQPVLGAASRRFCSTAAWTASRRICSKTAYTATRRFCSTTACAASGESRHVYSTAACTASRRIWSTAACAGLGGVLPTAACAIPGRVCLQAHVLHLYVCFVEQPVMYQEVSDLLQFVLYLTSRRFYACAGSDSGRVSLYKCFCATPGRVCPQEPVLHLHVSVYESFCCTWSCLPARALAPGDIWSAKAFVDLFWEKNFIFVAVVSIEGTNEISFTRHTKKQPKLIEFWLASVPT